MKNNVLAALLFAAAFAAAAAVPAWQLVRLVFVGLALVCSVAAIVLVVLRARRK